MSRGQTTHGSPTTGGQPKVYVDVSTDGWTALCSQSSSAYSYNNSSSPHNGLPTCSNVCDDDCSFSGLPTTSPRASQLLSTHVVNFLISVDTSTPSCCPRLTRLSTHRLCCSTTPPTKFSGSGDYILKTTQPYWDFTTYTTQPSLSICGLVSRSKFNDC